MSRLDRISAIGIADYVIILIVFKIYYEKQLEDIKMILVLKHLRK